MGWPGVVGRRPARCSTPGLTRRCGRTRSGGTVWAPTRRTTNCVFEEPDERFYLDVSSTRSEQWIVFSINSKTSSEAWLLPRRRPEGSPSIVRARVPDVEYSIDHWGDRFVVLTNLDAPDFRVMTAPIDAPGEWEELLPHVAGRRFTTAEPFAGHLIVHEWSDAQPRVLGPLPRRAPASCSSSGPSHTTSSLGPNPEWDTTVVRLSYQSLTTPATVYDHDIVTRRADPPQADADPERRPRPVHVGRGRGRSPWTT